MKNYDFSASGATAPPRIRRAVLADAPLLVDFNARLAQESEGKTLDASLLCPGVEAALRDSQRGLYFVAEDDTGMLGQMMITWEWSDWRNGWFWWIQSVYVRPEARRRGVFRALYEHVQQLARQDREVIGLRLYVEHANVAAQETYTRLGMKPAGYFVLEKYPL